MAQTKQTKKTPAKKTSAKASSAKKKASAAAQKKAAEELAMRRCVFGAVLLLTGFVGILSLCRLGGFLIRWYDGGFYWLLGFGAEVLPLCLLIVGALIIIRRRKKVRLQAICWLLVPLLFGAVRHLLRQPDSYYPALSGLRQMGADGRALVSGGVLGGGLAELLRAAFSTAGATVLTVLLLLVCVLGGCRVGFKELSAAFRKVKNAVTPLPEYEEEPETPREPARKVDVRPQMRTGRTNIDVPLDDQPVSRRTPDPNRKGRVAPPNVATPAEALRGMFHREKQAARAAVPEVKAEPDIMDDPIFQEPEVVVQQPVSTPGFVAEKPAAPVTPAAPAVEDRPPWEEPAAPKTEETPAAPDEPSVEEQISKAMEEKPDAPLYLYPPLRLLKPGKGKPAGSAEAIQACAERLVDTLESFGVQANVIDTTDGPAVTRYELVLQRGIKFSKVANLADDIALALGASGIRVSTIPEKNAVGIEVPNEYQEVVTARDIIGSQTFQTGKSRLSFAVGKDITGHAVVGDIAKMPHMLIAGTTGSGKSVCINSILISILYKSTPEEVRLIMVDPKMIELGVYNGIPHLLIPVVTDPKKAAGALNWAVTEMMRRYKLFSEVGARDLKSYNAEMERNISEGGSGEKLPQVVIVIDELSDLMAVARSEVEDAIIRLAQMARAAGMHLIIATQRPSADVITGLMKTNIPSRIAFAVASGIDSRIILDQTGAEKLLGKGDMLYFPLGLQKPQRVQGCFVSDQEVEEVVSFVKQCGTVEYDQGILDHIEKQSQQAEAAANGGGSAGGGFEDDDDEKFDEAVEIVVESGQASVSMLQRRLKLGYSRAARLVDEMEDRGIVGPFEGSKPRQVLITRQEWQERMIRKKEC